MFSVSNVVQESCTVQQYCHQTPIAWRHKVKFATLTLTLLHKGEVIIKRLIIDLPSVMEANLTWNGTFSSTRTFSSPFECYYVRVIFIVLYGSVFTICILGKQLIHIFTFLWYLLYFHCFYIQIGDAIVDMFILYGFT